ncbi:MAG: ATP synthase subunit I [Candidatus Thiodiazotropha sp.]|nr:ATP synthase subunit I [Candidatus Thiodiazotropha taylori]MBT3060279.1 ATP synthase subunit I [Candidatus Thiodiazotropha sp. (ex Lucina pensylvanica)]MBT3064809.1 ATP synthase subunit I [Candidatus Thiodiazotropha sp. (ex Lucina pensylvanica)]PUB74383.1 MAG: F0F1 ATP synthase assembly protein I [gamma proteobacterium symbiont of Ctena orbiculata]PUB74528.1 MAG: F0F1 ATP synthase assembly protein I [gamma proteobacterium symbiont of Ctena orbiculata]
MQLAGNSQIRTIVALQFGAALSVGLVLLAFGKTVAYSGFIGGLIAAAANGFFAYRSFTHYRAQDPQKIAGRMFGAEIQKLIVTGLMFGLTIVTISPLSIGALLGCYLLVQVAVPLIVLVFQDRQHS